MIIVNHGNLLILKIMVQTKKGLTCLYPLHIQKAAAAVIIRHSKHERKGTTPMH